MRRPLLLVVGCVCLGLAAGYAVRGRPDPPGQPAPPAANSPAVPPAAPAAPVAEPAPQNDPWVDLNPTEQQLCKHLDGLLDQVLRRDGPADSALTALAAAEQRFRCVAALSRCRLTPAPATTRRLLELAERTGKVNVSWTFGAPAGGWDAIRDVLRGQVKAGRPVNAEVTRRLQAFKATPVASAPAEPVCPSGDALIDRLLDGTLTLGDLAPCLLRLQHLAARVEQVRRANAELHVAIAGFEPLDRLRVLHFALLRAFAPQPEGVVNGWRYYLPLDPKERTAFAADERQFVKGCTQAWVEQKERRRQQALGAWFTAADAKALASLAAIQRVIDEWAGLFDAATRDTPYQASFRRVVELDRDGRPPTPTLPSLLPEFVPCDRYVTGSGFDHQLFPGGRQRAGVFIEHTLAEP